MAVYLDTQGHLLPDPQEPDLEELHRIAQAIGLKREWFQDQSPARFPHYDVIGSRKRTDARNAGAITITPTEWMRQHSAR
jgi:hypothetical protein